MIAKHLKLQGQDFGTEVKQQTKMPINFKIDNGYDLNEQNLIDDTSLDESIDFGKEEEYQERNMSPVAS